MFGVTKDCLSGFSPRFQIPFLRRAGGCSIQNIGGCQCMEAIGSA